MEQLTYAVPCLMGVEGLVAQELRDMGCEQVQAENGRVLCQGGWETLARLNLNCRYGERVLLHVGEFTARSCSRAPRRCPGRSSWEGRMPSP